MSPSTSTEQSGLAFNPPTNTRVLASRPSPTLSVDCESFHGIPLFPASDSYVCGTKTNNVSLISTCCNEAEVNEYLGCFMHCKIDNFNPSTMRDFVACLSNNGNSTAPDDARNIDPNVFCQGQLNASATATSAGTTLHSSPRPLSFMFIATFIVFFLVEAASAACTVSIESGSGLIRQGEAQSIGAPVSCGGDVPYCIVDQTGTDEIAATNRTIDGNDASDEQYDQFFEALGESTDPPRLFAATSSIQVRQWAVGVADDNMINHSFWAPFLYCVNATANDCNGPEDGTVEACGALYQSGTGLDDDDTVVQGVFLRTSRPGPFA